MNYERKALDLAREHKGVSPVLLMTKLKIRFDEAEKLAESTNAEYQKRVENTKRTRFQPAVRAPGKRKMMRLTQRTKSVDDATITEQAI